MDVPAALARVWYVAGKITVQEILARVSVVGEAKQHRYLAVALSCRP